MCVCALSSSKWWGYPTRSRQCRCLACSYMARCSVTVPYLCPSEEATLTRFPITLAFSRTLLKVLPVDLQVNPFVPAMPPAAVLQVLFAQGQEHMHPCPVPHKHLLPIPVQVEATKFTEVGFHGRDVDQIIRDLVDNAVTLMKQKQRAALQVRTLLSGTILAARGGWAVKQRSFVQEDHRAGLQA